MFKNRTEAGYLLARKLAEDGLITRPEKTIILGIVRGGVVLARSIADFFKTDMDIIMVKKIPAPDASELAIGAIGETRGSYFFDKNIIDSLNVKKKYLEKTVKQKLQEIKKKEKIYRFGRKPVVLKNMDVVIVDDGSATGATMVAAAREVWNNNPHRVILALPVAPADTKHILEKEADGVVVLKTPEPFFSVGQFYESFEQLSDQAVKLCWQN